VSALRPLWWRLLTALALALLASPAVEAQPDPRQMSGIPRPDGQQAPRSVSVRVIRGAMTNNVAGQPVDLLVNGATRTVRTGEDGRAQFDDLTPGATLKAVTVVDGQRLESQEFPAPAAGQPGIRLLLVAIDKDAAARDAAAVSAPAVVGEVAIGSRSRIVVEPGDESVRVFYLLELVNSAATPVNTAAPFMFSTPTEAQGTAVMEGPPEATANGTTVRVPGPFPPGATFLQVGYALPAPSGAAEIVQTFPAALDHLPVMVKKAGDVRLSSPQIDRQQEMPLEGDAYIVGVGDHQIPAGETITLSLTGLPHHSAAPRWIALSIAAAIGLAGFWAARRPHEAASRGDDRRTLIARREKLFQELLRLEVDARRGKADSSRHARRREEIIGALEHVYGALDTDDTGPEPADRAGRAA